MFACQPCFITECRKLKSIALVVHSNIPVLEGCVKSATCFGSLNRNIHKQPTNINTYILTYIHTRTYIRTYIYVDKHIHTNLHKHVHTYIHICVRTYTHTHRHGEYGHILNLFFLSRKESRLKFIIT
jgi:hypothetical protein